MVDTADSNTRRLAERIRARDPNLPVDLRAKAKLGIIGKTPAENLTPEFSHLLFPWQQWAKEIAREGSVLANKLAESGLVPPQEPLQIIPVNQIRACFHLDDGGIIDQAKDWDGPPALAVPDGKLFVRLPTQDTRPNADASVVDQIDAAIAHEAAILLGGAGALANLKPYADGILATLERPSTVLKRLRETSQHHFLYQYHDQVADPKFAELFDEYQRTIPSSKHATELKEKMHAILTEGFVQARRDQIRGHGYDEFSVFAELLQNAEDAYIQRSQLGMEMPPIRDIIYRYTEVSEGMRVLDVEHHGRPFNYWQHGPHQDPNLSRDAEGVLRSAGSFKPHVGLLDTGTTEMPTIGRFGLGFKSVYLLTDRPEIHSGSWHFAIEGGCLPEEEAPPCDINGDVTRIRLPLRADAAILHNSLKLLNLLPFLGMVRRLEFHPGKTAPAEFTVITETERLIEFGSMLIEEVAITCPNDYRDGSLRFIRCRSHDHAGQLGLLLARDGAPARWDEVFDHDLFAVLPLKAKLGCGVAASHRFEVQSGRTHLVDPKENGARFAEVGALLEGLAHGLSMFASDNTSISGRLARFWAFWQWGRGDTECEPLQKELAKKLIELAARSNVVPTLDPERPTNLADGPRFFFSEIPNTFRKAIIDVGVVIPVADFSDSALSLTNVVAEGFAGAYRRVCEYAGVSRAGTLVEVDWDKLAKIFQESAWFAEKPELLSILAESLNEEQANKAAAWVAFCRVLGEDGAGLPIHAFPSDLLLTRFPGCEHLPKRFLCRISAVYGDVVIDLLMRAGLRAQPSIDDLRDWIGGNELTAAEGIGILHYLADSDRFMNFRDLRGLVRSSWFPWEGQWLSIAQATDQGLIPEEIIEDEVFRTWLGIIESQEMPEPEPLRSKPDPKQVLENLFAWWQVHGQDWARKYEGRVYPMGRPPSLRDHFSPTEHSERKQWITLFLLGSLHSMGRTTFEQHRNFLRLCEQKGWLDVFADVDWDAQRWMQVLEEYLEDPGGRQDYYQWVKQFVGIFQISRWLPEYVESVLNVNRITEPFALAQITAPRTNALFSGGGPDAPNLTRFLGIGACFVMRELARMDRIQQPHAYRYCYVPFGRVCYLLEYLGCSTLRTLSPDGRSSKIYQFMIDHLGSERATFDQSFDLPLLALAETSNLQYTLLGEPLPQEESSNNRLRVDEGWRTLPDGRRINLYW